MVGYDAPGWSPPKLIEKNDWRKIKKEAKEVKNEFCKRNSLD